MCDEHGVVAQINRKNTASLALSDRYTWVFLTDRPRVFSVCLSHSRTPSFLLPDRCSYAIAVAIIHDESGKLRQEELPIPMKAASGSWIVRIKNEGLLVGPFYILSLNRDGITRASIEILYARGFCHVKAVESAATFEGKQGRAVSLE